MAYLLWQDGQAINVITAMNSLDVIIDAETPILASSNPESGSYVNKDENRLVEIIMQISEDWMAQL